MGLKIKVETLDDLVKIIEQIGIAAPIVEELVLGVVRFGSNFVNAIKEAIAAKQDMTDGELQVFIRDYFAREQAFDNAFHPEKTNEP